MIKLKKDSFFSSLVLSSYLNKAISDVISTYLWSTNDLNILSTSIDHELDSRPGKIGKFF